MPQFNSTLLPGTRLKEFEVIRTLGIGGFGITYLARDTRLGREVAIKEYFPAEFAARSDAQTISPRSEQHADDYQWGMDRFIEEAKALARFDHPSIVRVIRFFEANGSAYLVMEHVEGRSLSAELKESKTLPEHRVREIVDALLNGLEQAHAVDLLHRDIKPGNVMLQKDGRPVLIDFGAARSIAGQHSRTMTAVLTPGYAPIEQYGSQGKQGPWTDIYSVGALAYKCLSGKTPEDATDRFRQDQMLRVAEASAQNISEKFARAIDAALRVEESKRPQTIAQWRGLIEAGAPYSGEEKVSSPSQPAREESDNPSMAEPMADRRQTGVWQYATAPLRKYATFSGRAQRKEYWLFHLFYLGLIGTLAWLASSGVHHPFFVFLILVPLVGFLPSLAVTVRRFHDINLSGWWYVAAVLGSAILDYYALWISFAIWIGLLFILCKKGTDGPNRFGLDPLA